MNPCQIKEQTIQTLINICSMLSMFHTPSNLIKQNLNKKTLIVNLRRKRFRKMYVSKASEGTRMRKVLLLTTPV